MKKWSKLFVYSLSSTLQAPYERRRVTGCGRRFLNLSLKRTKQKHKKFSWIKSLNGIHNRKVYGLLYAVKEIAPEEVINVSKYIIKHTY